MGAPSSPGFKLEPIFFGLKPEDRTKIHELIFDLVWIGEGRWDFHTIYHMPIFLREFYIKKIQKINSDRSAKNTPEKKYTKDLIAKPPL
jgi:hypothetical protein